MHISIYIYIYTQRKQTLYWERREGDKKHPSFHTETYFTEFGYSITKHKYTEAKEESFTNSLALRKPSKQTHRRSRPHTLLHPLAILIPSFRAAQRQQKSDKGEHSPTREGNKTEEKNRNKQHQHERTQHLHIQRQRTPYRQTQHDTYWAGELFCLCTEALEAIQPWFPVARATKDW